MKKTKWLFVLVIAVLMALPRRGPENRTHVLDLAA